MPLLPLSSSKYAPIPETEDVTPLGRDLPEVYPDKSRKILYFTIIFAVLIIPFIMLYEDLHKSYWKSDTVLAFQTSKQSFTMHQTVGQIMHQMDSNDVSHHWTTKGLSKLSFGNVNSYSEDEKKVEFSNAAKVKVNRNIVKQEVLGFGGAFTESSAINFYKLSNDVREKILSLYFQPLRKSHDLTVNADPSNNPPPSRKLSDLKNRHLKSSHTNSASETFSKSLSTLSLLQQQMESILSSMTQSFLNWPTASKPGSEESGFTLGRIHINSCDFSLEPYNFDNVTNDFDLNFFDHDVTHDTVKIIPFITEAMMKSKNPIKLVASPWSPPAWMKVPESTNKSSMLGSALPNGLRNEPQVKLAWARYLSYFVSAYARKGIPVWGLTPQNEPEFPAPWEACSYTADFEAEFIGNYLGPIIKNDHPDIKLLAFDHNKDHLKRWTEVMFHENNNARNYIDGMAFHWYGGMDRLTDGTYGYNDVADTHQLIPDKLLLGTEGCSCPGIEVDGWLRAERLGHDIMFDLQNYANGWIDWNLLVDARGGPNHLHNFCDASMFTSKDFSDVHIQPKFFYFAHYFRFVVPGSKHIESKIIGNYQYEPMDPHIQAGVEIGLFSCEKSVRQMWTIDLKTNAITLQVSSTMSLDNQALCIARGDTNRPYLRLAACGTSPVQEILQVVQNANGQIIDSTTGLCVAVDGNFKEGALLALKDCESERISISQMFKLTEHQELIASNDQQHLCTTGGWPFLNGVSFVTPQNHTVLVLMNEASVASKVVVSDTTKDDALAMAIDASSIQTIIY